VNTYTSSHGYTVFLALLIRAFSVSLLVVTGLCAQQESAPLTPPNAAAGAAQSQGAQPVEDQASASADARRLTNSAANSDTVSSPDSSTKSDPRYHIGPGDVLEIRVFNRPNLSLDAVRVDASGLIRMPLLNEVKAACLSENELSEVLAHGYSEYLKDPQIYIFIKEFSSEAVQINGAVQKPGAFQLQRQVRLRELLMIAGGPTSIAGPTIQILHDDSALLCEDSTSRRRSRENPQAELVDYNDMVKGAGNNPYIRPGDFINVPEANQAYVVGNVYKPTPVPLNGPVTISRAIAMAGGALPSSQSKLRLLRVIPGAGGTREILIDLKSVQTQTNEDLLLLPGDIVEVPFSTAKAILKQVFTSFASSALFYYPVLYIK
jgi:polysaccharide export outer membrane protein